MNATDNSFRALSWGRYLLRRFGHSATHSRRNQRSILLRRMMFTARKPI